MLGWLYTSFRWRVEGPPSAPECSNTLCLQELPTKTAHSQSANTIYVRENVLHSMAKISTGSMKTTLQEKTKASPNRDSVHVSCGPMYGAKRASIHRCMSICVYVPFVRLMRTAD